MESWILRHARGVAGCRRFSEFYRLAARCLPGRERWVDVVCELDIKQGEIGLRCLSFGCDGLPFRWWRRWMVGVAIRVVS